MQPKRWDSTRRIARHSPVARAHDAAHSYVITAAAGDPTTGYYAGIERGFMSGKIAWRNEQDANAYYRAIMMVPSLLLVAPLLFALQAAARRARSPTPPMGWNSYNTWNCLPTEEKIHQSARGLVDLGFADVGYSFVTVDCGWNTHERDAEGRLQWNETLFPSGGKALGDFLHGLGLEFGLYSGAGYLQCGDESLPASLGFEQLDAQTFAEWGGDSLKYGKLLSIAWRNG